MKKKNLILPLFILCIFMIQSNAANAGYVHSIQVGGDENKETIEYFSEDATDKVTSKGTVVNYNYITPVAPPSTYYDDSYYYYPYTTTKYRVIRTYPYINVGYRHTPPPPPIHHLHHGHRPPPPPMHRPPHRHHGHSKVHIGLPGIHVRF